MKYLNTRQELAQYINVKGVPCCSINMDNITDDKWKYAEGSEVRVAYDTPSYGILKTRGNIYTQEGKWYISNEATCLHNGSKIYKTEALEMMMWANAPTVEEGDELVVLAYSNKTSVTLAMVLTVGKVDKFCSTVCELE